MRTARRLPAAPALVLAIAAASCGGDGGSGASATRVSDIPSARGTGPVGIYLPEDPDSFRFPFPHDSLTTLDPDTATGRRLALPEEADTSLSEQIRSLLNRQDGFDPFTPMQVSFDEPIRLDSLEVNRDADPRRHSLFVFNVDPDSPRFGERVELDFAAGNFPFVRPPRSYFPNDPLEAEPQYVFDPSNRVGYYEDETNTIWIRPVVPMADAATHALVLTTRILGEDGEPIRSPHAPAVALDGQAAELDPVLPMLAELGVGADEIAWAYTFTTGSPLIELTRIHDGLVEGRGPLAYLRDRFPARLELKPFSRTEGDDFLDVAGNDLLLDPPVVEIVGRFAIPLLGGDTGDLVEEAIDQLVDLSSIGYFVQGTFDTPFFLSTPNRHFEPIETSGRRELAPDDVDLVPWFLSVPKPTARNGFAEPPYPVCIFQHPNSTSRVIALGVASIFSDYGLAVIGIDAAENGPIAPFATDQLLALITSGDTSGVPLAGLIDTLLDRIGNRADTIALVDVFTGTSRTPEIDFNGDGVINSGEETFTGDVPTVRDIFRQTVVDLMQLTRALRGLGVDANGNGRLDPEEGDFDQDGVLDLGGADGEIVLGAMSLGTFMAGPFLALTKEIDRGALNAPGGGGLDILGRIEFGVIDQLFVQVFGPALVGRPSTSGSGIDVTLIDDVGDERDNPRIGPFAVPANAVVQLENLSEERTEPRRERVEPDGTFLITIPADPGDRLRLSWFDTAGRALDLPEVRVTVERHGFGARRNTPELRNFATVTQNAFGPGDGVHFATRWTREPLPGRNPKQVLIQSDPDDFTVPTSTAITLGRAAGLIGPQRMRELIDGNIVVGAIPRAGISTAVPELPLPPGQSDRYATLDYDLTRTYPFEDLVTGSGFVFHLASNHEYLFAPSTGESGPIGAWLTIAAQAQMALFLSEGRIVVPFHDLLEDMRARGRVIPRLPGVDD